VKITENIEIQTIFFTERKEMALRFVILLDVMKKKLLNA
jgi:hypothetical protein